MKDPTRRRYCYWVSETQDPELYGGWVPSAVFEDEPGHSMMTGNPEQLQAPWVWGKTLAEAKAVCAEKNRRLGISEEEAALIVLHSMGLTREAKRRGAW